MTLGKRAIVLILPALSLGFFLAFLGMYHSQRDMLIETERSKAKMQASELANAITHYSALARNHLHTFLHSPLLAARLHPGDDLVATERPMADILQHARIHSADGLAMTVFDPHVRLLYSLPRASASAAEFESLLRRQVANMYREQISDASVYFDTEHPMLSSVRIVDRRTLLAPTHEAFGNTIAVVASVEASRFRSRRAAIIAEGSLVSWNRPTANHSVHPLSIVADEALPPLGLLSVIVPAAHVAQKLGVIKHSLAQALLAIGAISAILLSFLIWRFITRPIHYLEHDLSTFDCNERASLGNYDSQDEIGSLGRTFVNMYEDLRKSYQITREMAERDGLTRLYNRRMFQHQMDRLLLRAGDAEAKLALLYIDVDNFKFINDTYGHGIGDEVLRNFADRLADILRPGDLLHSALAEESQDCAARLAGDEFAVLLYGYDDDDVPRRVAERILGICHGEKLAANVRCSTSLSIGVACFPSDAQSATELISNADSAMYQAKNNGKNQYSFYSGELAAQSRRVVEIETELKQLCMEQFDLHYMPIVDASDLRIVAVEALIRWHSPTLGSVSPAEFIPIAESTGAFRHIDRWVLQRANHDLPALQRVLGPELKISINVSAAELESREFFDEVSNLVAEQRIRPEHFELEITETFHINNRTGSEDILRQLGRLGFSISIDDFGTGFTSLIQLVEYPVDKIKLDKSFLEKVIERDRTAIISSLVEFCKSQSFSITAEGVESEDQASILRDAGCDYLQGFHFYRPAPLDALIVDIALHGQKGQQQILPQHALGSGKTANQPLPHPV